MSQPLLTDQERAVISGMIRKHGARTTAIKLGIGRLALSNAVAALDITDGTIVLIRKALEDDSTGAETNTNPGSIHTEEKGIPPTKDRDIRGAGDRKKHVRR